MHVAYEEWLTYTESFYLWITFEIQTSWQQDRREDTLAD